MLALPGIGGPSLAISYRGMFLAFVYVWLPYMMLPIQTALERVPRSLMEASGDLGARPGQTFCECDAAARDTRRGGRVDLYVFADAGRFCGAGGAGQLQLFYRQAVLSFQGSSGNVPLAAAFTMVPIVDHDCVFAAGQADRRI